MEAVAVGQVVQDHMFDGLLAGRPGCPVADEHRRRLPDAEVARRLRIGKRTFYALVAARKENAALLAGARRDVFAAIA